jgi:hypothetical protein
MKPLEHQNFYRVLLVCLLLGLMASGISMMAGKVLTRGIEWFGSRSEKRL